VKYSIGDKIQDSSIESLNFEKALLDLDRVRAEEILFEKAKSSSSLYAIDSIVSPALQRIGSAWDSGEIALSQEYMAGKITEQLVDKILPPESPERLTSPRIAITTLGDFHMLGKKIVVSVLKSIGYSVLDYGGMQVEDVVKKVGEDDVDILLASTLMFNFALKVGELKKSLDENNLDVMLIVGGAPFLFDAQLETDVGADIMARTAGEVLAIVEKYVEGQ